jgi:hypothetical protein
VGYAPGTPPMGICTWFAELKQLFPMLRFGYFNPALR